jgi:hypothetical protein
MFEKIKLRKQINMARKKLEMQENQLELRRIEYAQKTIEDLLEARNTIIDDDLVSGNWFLTGQAGEDQLVDEFEQQSMLEGALKLYHDNPHARAIIRGLVKFTLGRGPTIMFDSNNKKVKEIWQDFVRRNKLSRKEKEAATRLFRDGEFFLREFIDKNNGNMTIRFVRASHIRNPKNISLPENITFGIETDPNDIENVLHYYMTNGQGNLVAKIPADEMIHEKIFADSDQKR